MSWQTVIIVEGLNDGRFIESLVRHLGYCDVAVKRHNGEDPPDGEIMVYEINGVGEGKRAFNGKHITLCRHLRKAEKGLFILDANGCADERRQAFELLRQHKEFPGDDVSVDLFLTPDDKSDGALETLLKGISVRQDIYGCMKNYKDCIAKLGCAGAPDLKAEVYAYCEANDIDADRADYTDTQFWNLDAECLLPLKNFLTKHLTPSA